MLFRAALSFIAATLGFSTLSLATAAEQTCIAAAAAIEEKLACIEGLSFQDTSGPTTPPGAKIFTMQFTQPTDHGDAAAGTFAQKLVLLHRSETEPMVLQTSGYAIFAVRQAALTEMFATNQLQVEHRFFAASTPAPLDWSKLNIKQSADDFHRITVALRQIYERPWVNTGASKGGMTSVYHHYYYPDDVAGTVADVAPLSFSTSDERYAAWIDQVGGDTYQECREKLRQVQIGLLRNRDDLVPTITGAFDFLGSADVAFEHAVIESSFVFWQYESPTSATVGCDKIPADGSPAEMLAWLSAVNDVATYGDVDLQKFIPYYFQAAAQLGNPGSSMAHVEALRRHDFTIDQYTPKGVAYTYSNASMHEVDTWVKTAAAHIIFVYGEYDPWSAGAFALADNSDDMHKFWVKGGNHSAKYLGLADEDRARVVAILSRWLGKQPATNKGSFSKSGSLEEAEAKVRRRLRL